MKLPLVGGRMCCFFTAHLTVLKYIQLFSVAFVFTYLKMHLKDGILLPTDKGILRK